MMQEADAPTARLSTPEGVNRPRKQLTESERREADRNRRASRSALLSMLPEAPPSGQLLAAAAETMRSGERVPEKGNFEGKSYTFPWMPGGGIVSKTLRAGTAASTLSQSTHDDLQTRWCHGGIRSPCCPLLATEVTTSGAEGAHKLQSPERITLQDFFGPRYPAMLRASRVNGHLPVEEVRQLCARDREKDPVGVALWLVRDLIAAVNCLHASGYIHGDIKDPNVLADCRRAPALGGRTCVRWTAVLFDLDTVAEQAQRYSQQYDAWADDYFATSVTIGRFLAGQLGLLRYLRIGPFAGAPTTRVSAEKKLKLFAMSAENAGLLAAPHGRNLLINAGFPILDWTQYYLHSYRVKLALGKYPKISSVMTILTKSQKVTEVCSVTPTISSVVDSAWEDLCKTIEDILGKDTEDGTPEPVQGASTPRAPRPRDTGGLGLMTGSCIVKV